MKSKPLSARSKAWTHNGLAGTAAFVEKSMDRIQSATTTTQESKLLAHDIQRLAGLLRTSLKKRVD